MTMMESEDVRRIVDQVVLAHQGTVARPGQPPVRGLERGLWAALAESGFSAAGVPEEFGGSGGDDAVALAVIGAVAARAGRVPLLEHLWMAGWLLPTAGIALPAGPVTFGLAEITLTDDHVTARAEVVPWAAEADHLALLGQDGLVALVPRALATVSSGTDLAHTSTGTVELDAVELPAGSIAASPVTHEQALLRLTQGRLHQIHAAGSAAVELTREYVGQRHQFGRPLTRFQAVQQRLSVAVAELTLLGLGSELATRSGSRADIALARVDARRAVGAVAREVHQLFGAMGVTAEHPVSALTGSMRAWLSSTGPDATWRAIAAEAVRGEGMWRLIVGGTDD